MKTYSYIFLFFLANIFSTQAQTIQAPVVIYYDPDVDILSNIHSADFDGDGLDDLLFSSADINAFWMKNLGSGAFGPLNVLYNDEIFGESVKAGDLDNDGDMDVALACSFSNIIVWIENLGGGDFADGVILAEGLDPLTDLILDDFNQDGMIDIMFSTYSATSKEGQIFWIESMNGVFSTTKTISLEISDSRKIQYADLNGDGMKDVISASYWDYKFVWFENQGQGLFSSEKIIRNQLDSIRNHCIYAIDLDGDGDVDILNGIASAGDQILWFENDGSANFTEHAFSNAGRPWDIVASDLDYDGDIDVFCGLSGENTAVLFDNLGNGSFSDPQVIATGIGVIHDIHLTDIDGDLDLDIFTTSALADIGLLFRNEADVTVHVSQAKEQKWDVYPNPSSGVFHIKVETELLGKQMELYDFQGKKHFQTRIESEAQLIAIPKVVAGSYILVIRDHHKKIMSKRLIQVTP